MRVRPAILASVGGLLAVAGCTSSQHSAPRPSASASASTADRPAPVASSFTASAGTSSSVAPSTSPSAAGFARLRDAFLLVGPTPASADVYEVTPAGLTRRTTDARVSAITADRDRVVVDAHDHLDELVGSALRPFGDRSAFSPALSADGKLATVALQGGPSTPGITKPRGFELRIQRTRAAPRARYTTTSSLGNPVWTGPDTLVIAASDGTHTTLLSIDTARRTRHQLATLTAPAAVSLTAGSVFLTAGQQGRFTVLPLVSDRITGGGGHPVPTGWTPVCWTGPSTLVAVRGRELATVAVSSFGATSPQPFAQVPAGLSTFGADCSRVVHH